MNEYRQSAINYLKIHFGYVGYRDYLLNKLEKLERIEQIIDEYNNGDDMEYEYLAKIREILESEEK